MELESSPDLSQADPDRAAPISPAGAREWLRLTPWLAGVPAGTLGRLAGEALVHRVPAGSMIFEQAETPVFATLLVCGTVGLLAVRDAAESLVELATPFDMLLPAAVLNRQPYLLRARVLEEAHLLLIPAAAFRDAVAADHALCLAILALQAAQFRRQVRHIKNMQLRSAVERAGTYLLRLAQGQSARRPIRLPMEKRLIASQLGMTRETFSRALSAMAKHGLKVDGDVLVIEDLERARARFPLDPLIDGDEAINPVMKAEFRAAGAPHGEPQ
ncbi:MAG: helix-turn-helix domain-containing protein [Proteobacteria bacterium]|nr:helix-turn-helix domain-containing protein [Pseudomonadota bacterium]